MSKERPLPTPAPYVPPPDPPDPGRIVSTDIEGGDPRVLKIDARLIALEAKDPTARLAILESRLEALEKLKPVTP